MGENGRKFAEKLDWKTIAEKIERLYLDVIKESK